MRGTWFFHVFTKDEREITPARAGNMGDIEYQFVMNKDHPRACGEHRRRGYSHAVLLGSPPRVRGTSAHLWPPVVLFRITPARAGNIIKISHKKNWRQDHPRACGEHRPGGFVVGYVEGSPPRVRGTLHTRAGLARHCEITPARAGNIVLFPDFLDIGLHHPRACGEHCFDWTCCPLHSGSPPRVRGT